MTCVCVLMVELLDDLHFTLKFVRLVEYSRQRYGTFCEALLKAEEISHRRLRVFFLAVKCFTQSWVEESLDDYQTRYYLFPNYGKLTIFF